MNLTDTNGDVFLLSGLLRRVGERWTAGVQYRPVSHAGASRDWRAEIGSVAGSNAAITVQLAPAAGAKVQGTIGLTALLEGETRFDMTLTGLQAGASYTLQLQAGTPDQPSASVVQVTTVTADVTGQATASGLVRFRGTENIPLGTIADGNHFLSIVHNSEVVATGTVPAM